MHTIFNSHPCDRHTLVVANKSHHSQSESRGTKCYIACDHAVLPVSSSLALHYDLIHLLIPVLVLVIAVLIITLTLRHRDLLQVKVLVGT